MAALDTSTEFDAAEHHRYLQTLPTYAANADCLKHVAWTQDGSSHILANKSDKSDAVLIVVGRVVNDRVFCGPAGNWSSKNSFGSLKTARYQFTIGAGEADLLAADFEAAFKMLSKIQGAIAFSPKREHLLVGENEKFHNIRFSTNVFEARPTPVNVPQSLKAVTFKGFEDAIYLSDISTTPPPDFTDQSTSDETLSDSQKDDDEKPTLDTLTMNWPVPEEMKSDLHKLMSTHCAQPLPVYKDDKYVKPDAVNDAIRGALVEVHFTIRHYRIWKKATNNEPPTCTDSFTGNIQQVIILSSAIPRPSTAYKRKNLADGPFRPKPRITASPRTEGSPLQQTPSDISTEQNSMQDPTFYPSIASTSAMPKGKKATSTKAKSHSTSK